VNPFTPRKYGNKKVEVDGSTFDSKAEARRYEQLKLMLRAGAISELQLQPKYELQPAYRDRTGKHQRAITYSADFAYVENGGVVVEDVKGMETEVFKIKAKMVRYRYPDIDFRLVK
jgi:hypothetical protein